MLDQVHPFTRQTAPGCRAGDSGQCEFPLSYRGEQYQCTGLLVDRGNPALCPAATQVYTGTLAARLTRGNLALCPTDCNQLPVPGNIFKYCSGYVESDFCFISRNSSRKYFSC